LKTLLTGAGQAGNTVIYIGIGLSIRHGCWRLCRNFVSNGCNFVTLGHIIEKK